MSIRTGSQVERLLWAAAEARRLRVEPREPVRRTDYATTALAMPPEQFTTEWEQRRPA